MEWMGWRNDRQIAWLLPIVPGTVPMRMIALEGRPYRTTRAADGCGRRQCALSRAVHPRGAAKGPGRT